MDDINVEPDDAYITTMMHSANDMVKDVQERFHGQAIPAILAACAMWAVDFGLADAMKDTLENTKNLVDVLQADLNNQIN